MLVASFTLLAKATPRLQQTLVTFRTVVLVLLQGETPTVDSTMMENLAGYLAREVLHTKERLVSDATASWQGQMWGALAGGA